MKRSKSKAKRSLFIGLTILLVAGILAFVYSTTIQSPLVAGVLEDYQLNTGRTGGREAEKEAITNPEKFAKDSKDARDQGAAAVAAANTAKAEAIAAGKTGAAVTNAGVNAANAAIEEVKKTGTYTPKNPEEKQIYDNSINTSNAAIAAENEFHKAMNGMTDEEKLKCIGDGISDQSTSDACKTAHTLAGNAYAQVITGLQSSSGAACAGGAAGVGIGHQQWAQTGRGYKKGTTEICNSNADCAGSDLRECVQCVDGRYNNAGAQVCGQGSASHYITRPDQTNQPKNCWKDGAYYSDSSSLDGKGCSNGSWVDKIVEKDLDLAAISAAEQDKKGACENDGVGHYYKGYCYSSESTMNAKIRADELIANQANINQNDCTRNLCTKTACETVKSNKVGGGSCALIQGTVNMYGFIPLNSSVKSISYNTGITAGRPTSFTGGYSDTIYKTESDCNRVKRVGEICEKTTTSGTSGSTVIYRLNAGTFKADLTYNFGSNSASGYGIAAPVNTNNTSKDIASEPCKYGYRSQSTECADAPTSGTNSISPTVVSAAKSTGTGALWGVGTAAVGCGAIALGTGGLTLPFMGICMAGLAPITTSIGAAVGLGAGIVNNNSDASNSQTKINSPSVPSGYGNPAPASDIITQEADVPQTTVEITDQTPQDLANEIRINNLQDKYSLVIKDNPEAFREVLYKGWGQIGYLNKTICNNATTEGPCIPVPGQSNQYVPSGAIERISKELNIDLNDRSSSK